MTRIRRRLAREARFGGAELHHLRSGHPHHDCLYLIPRETLEPDAWPWVVDEAALRAAWREHSGEVWAQTEPGYVPWAARRFDGVPGPVSPYEHLEQAR